MEEDKIVEILEGLEIPSNKIDEFMAAFKQIQENPDEKDIQVGPYTITHLKEELNNETDWRKKASIAAKIISLGLE